MSNIQSTSTLPTQQHQNSLMTPPPINPKYGLPKRNLVYQRLHPKKFFDSADWVLEGGVNGGENLINPAFANAKVH